MTWKMLNLMPLTLLTACSTMNGSLQLGASMGAATGAAATYAGYSAGGKSPSIGTVALGAGIGSALGLITSYLVHRQVEEDRSSCESNQVDIKFGDLPPSPFQVPKTLPKGGRQ